MKYLFLVIVSLACISSQAQQSTNVPAINSLSAKKSLVISAYSAVGGGFGLDKRKVSEGTFLMQNGISLQYFFAPRLSLRGGYYLTNTFSKTTIQGVGKNANNLFADINFYPKFLGGYVYLSMGSGYSFNKSFDISQNTWVHHSSSYSTLGFGVNVPVNKFFKKAGPNWHFEYFANVPINLGGMRDLGLTNPTMSNGGLGIKYLITRSKN